jgi:DNA polymerase I
MTLKSKSSTLVLFDGNAILHRAYHAFPPTLQTKTGELTNATYGFTSTLLNVFKKLKPTHVAVTFDRKEKTFRHKQFKAYKASRPKMDEELVSQIERTKQVVDSLNIPRFEKIGFEADDLLGTISKKMESVEVDQVFIVTGDKDILQLLTQKTQVYYPSRGQKPEKTYTVENFVKEYGFTPIKMIDYKALAGDQSDEIPGVKGVGPKSATKLLIEFGSLENIYKNIDKITGSLKTKLVKDKKMAELSKDLATIHTNVNLKFELKKCQLIDYDKEKAIDLFSQLEFFSLIKRLPQDRFEDIFLSKIDEDNQKQIKESQISLF